MVVFVESTSHKTPSSVFKPCSLDNFIHLAVGFETLNVLQLQVGIVVEREHCYSPFRLESRVVYRTNWCVGFKQELLDLGIFPRNDICIVQMGIYPQGGFTL